MWYKFIHLKYIFYFPCSFLSSFTSLFFSSYFPLHFPKSKWSLKKERKGKTCLIVPKNMVNFLTCGHGCADQTSLMDSLSGFFLLFRLFAAQLHAHNCYLHLSKQIFPWCFKFYKWKILMNLPFLFACVVLSAGPLGFLN